MKILLVTPFYAPGVGGSSRLLEDIMEYLLIRGHEIEVITFGDPDSTVNKAYDASKTHRIFRIKPRSGAGLSTLNMALRALTRCATQRFDLILCGAAYPSALVGCLMRLIFRVPYIVYSHGEDVTCARDSPKKAKLLRRALASAAYVMTNSSFSLSEARAFGARSEFSDTAPPSIDPQPYESVDSSALAALRNRLGIGEGPVILTVARMHERKGHDTVIRALPKILQANSDVRYLIVGKGDPSRLIEIAAEQNVSDHVTIVDYVADDELPLLYHLCDVYVMVSRWDPVSREVEGFGIVYLEAGASGKPCVAGSAGGCADAVESGVTGFVVDPESVEDVASAVGRLLTDKQLADLMGEAGRIRVTEKFSKAHALPRIEQIMCTYGAHDRKS